MAGLRNLAIGALRLAGRTDITEATRWAGRSMDRPFTILGLHHDLGMAVGGRLSTISLPYSGRKVDRGHSAGQRLMAGDGGHLWAMRLLPFAAAVVRG